jgi:hypothetical protein
VSGTGHGSDKIVMKAHLHNCDEIVAFIGTKTSDPHDLGSTKEIWLNDEKYLRTLPERRNTERGECRRQSVFFVLRGVKYSR